MKTKNTVFFGWRTGRSAVICALVALSLFGSSIQTKAQNFDVDLLRNMHVDRNEKLDPAFRALTQSASPLSMMAPATVFGVGFFTMNRSVKQQGLYIAEAMAINTLITYGLKLSVNRDRPFATYPEFESSYETSSPSFPSGHTSNAFATATALTLVFPKWYVAVPSYAWASLIGYSRLHLGVHYPSDVLVGAIIGTGSAFLAAWVNKKLFYAPALPSRY